MDSDISAGVTSLVGTAKTSIVANFMGVLPLLLPLLIALAIIFFVWRYVKHAAKGRA
jgi:hypothetical protein